MHIVELQHRKRRMLYLKLPVKWIVDFTFRDDENEKVAIYANIQFINYKKAHLQHIISFKVSEFHCYKVPAIQYGATN